MMTTRSKTNPIIAVEKKVVYRTRSVSRKMAEEKTAKKTTSANKTFHIEPCRVKGCMDPNTHTDFNHSCLYCKEDAEEHLQYCPLNKIQTDENTVFDNITKLPQFGNEIVDINRKTKNLRRGEYTSVYADQGGCWYVRNNAGCKQYLLMFTDDWGQYGPDTSRMPRYRAFVHGYVKLTKD